MLDRLPDLTVALAKQAGEHDRTGSFPVGGIAEVHAAGLLTATVAPIYGGPGAGLADTVTIVRALGRGDPSVALITAMTLFAHAGQAQQPTWPEPLYAAAVAESAERPVLINALRTGTCCAPGVHTPQDDSTLAAAGRSALAIVTSGR